MSPGLSVRKVDTWSTATFPLDCAGPGRPPLAFWELIGSKAGLLQSRNHDAEDEQIPVD